MSRVLEEDPCYGAVIDSTIFWLTKLKNKIKIIKSEEVENL